MLPEYDFSKGVRGKYAKRYVVLESNARFWRLIESRRKQSTITMADMRRRVGTGRAQRSKRR